MSEDEARPTHPFVQGLHNQFGHGDVDLVLVDRINRNFARLSEWIIGVTPAGPEQTVALRKLLETKRQTVAAACHFPTLPIEPRE